HLRPRRLLEEVEPGPADLDLVARVEGLRGVRLQALAVEVGAVGRPQVDQAPLLTALLDPAVVTGGAVVGEDQVVAGAPADPERTGGDFEDARGLTLLVDDEPRHALLLSDFARTREPSPIAAGRRASLVPGGPRSMRFAWWAPRAPGSVRARASPAQLLPGGGIGVFRDPLEVDAVVGRQR